MDLLFVTGSTALAAAVSHTLESAGNQVDVAANVDELYGLLRNHDGEFDAVLIDDLSPHDMLDALAQHLSAQYADGQPETGRSSADQRTTAVRRPRIALLSTPSMAPASGDRPCAIVPDVTITKPFGDAELLSYMSLLQTGADDDGDSDANAPTLLIHGDLTLDTRAQCAYYRGTRKPIALSPREYSALEALIRANGSFLSFDDLSRLVFGDGTGFADQHSVMDTTMYSLTRKLRRLGFFITQQGDRYRIR